ncbi:bifunctional glutamate N-acetyltransferase/amino-acid acetyltransferase ArgJ [Motiliproteus coralliicola]|uniref:Arginine biosynthesis bifunctional protein ArgJ n=1 Tax=Motiliproteus coralliicola TaxID=2283196 RepID=A0A369WL48_9GAMM|nr:bifunctional glutamate N-acetyltransferase/amino-acid acetyltransferase ArgJ [Motiliproteus coralliicola]RDE22800.1 bifunctional glutamate N-acetyltransferase/amino-acid acetyltransferase ArgJ [Motiliproteus coralliicola]
MAVGPATLPTFEPISGFRLGTASAGIKTPGRLDLVVMELSETASVAGVFTRNAFCAAPVTLSKKHLAAGQPRYLLTNTGNANAGTGAEGMADASGCCAKLAELVGMKPEQVLPFSTGVIGEKLPVERIYAALPAAVEALSENGWEDAASGILTTDTRPKGASCSLELNGQAVCISGISKGAGMIRPNMATMLAYVATDAKVEQADLQALLSEVAERTFNRVTIDGDTSTNDSCMLVATGASGVACAPGHPEWDQFAEAVESVLRELAQAIVRDGEGATKFVSIEVNGALDSAEALKVAYAIAHSPLVKTALFASDPNWGRILAAVGYAGVEQLDLEALKIFLGDVCIVENGGRAADYTEEQGQAVMNQEDILIRVELARGEVSETVWTTDLSKDYVTINADYRS